MDGLCLRFPFPDFVVDLGTSWKGMELNVFATDQGKVRLDMTMVSALGAKRSGRAVEMKRLAGRLRWIDCLAFDCATIPYQERMVI